MLDLYRLLGLPPLESDMDRIQSALRRCLERARTSDDNKIAKRAKKLHDLGKHHLLDAKQKAVYDGKWKAEFATAQPVAATAVDSRLEWDCLRTSLPSGDPNSAFDLADFLESSGDFSTPSFDHDFSELLESLDSTDAPSPIFEDNSSAEANSLEDASPSQPRFLGSNLETSTAPTYAAQREPPKSLAKNLRKKRDHSLLVMVGGLLLSVAVVLAVILVVMNASQRSQSTASQQPSASPSNVPTANGRPGKPAPGGFNALPLPDEKPPPRGSGLPQLEIPEMATRTPSIGGDSIASMTRPDPKEPRQVVEASVKNSDPSNAQPSETESSEAEPSETESSGIRSSSPSTQPENTMGGTVATSIEWTDSEKSDWREALLGARKLLVQHDYEAAMETLRELEASAKTARQQNQLRSLRAARDLAAAAHQALLEAIKGMSAGEMLQVRSASIAFVEGSDERLVFKIAGQNQRFRIDQLPVGILEALLDLELDRINLKAQAQKACYILLHPRSTELVFPRARDKLSEAESSGQVPTGILQAIEGDFRLE